MPLNNKPVNVYKRWIFMIDFIDLRVDLSWLSIFDPRSDVKMVKNYFN